MNRTEISLPRKLTHRLLSLAQASPNQEICGLISADASGKLLNCYPVNNSAATPQTRFLLDASQQIAAMTQMREQGESLFGIYHSHPHTPALPSSSDIEQAAYPNAIHFIISLNTQGVLEIRGFKITGQTVEEVILTLTEN